MKKTILISIAVCAVALAVYAANAVRDVEGITVRYRSGSILSVDDQFTMKQEDSRWSMTEHHLGRLAFIQAGSAVSAADGTVTQTFAKIYGTLPTVIAGQCNAGNTVSNVLTSLTVSNFVLNVGKPSITNRWISIGDP